ncbi:DUF721 domain-containing protein [Beggiatoa leptomitoformis]|uniref:DUF721 domain-containing protein n=1 Tax=Beggiatoa leptomitoformis TaxID=288004 RepID=A0A2N9YCP0_9GAMM|nr:DUF721 domain-containing protein [Beggiatoa leptomitoformis]ALG66479.1 DUF721 domain-containing protein [Beggiatoa leptomitoformis]AUI68230.1 DUF721 domain-containing protein [Beggiatoa leptomitoformis]
MKTVLQILNHSSHIVHTVIERCAALQQIDRALKEHLPTVLRHHCSVANVREQVVVLWADSAPYATRLRYMSEEILHTWQSDPFLQPLRIKKIEIKVHSLDTALVKPSLMQTDKRRPSLSHETAMLLQNVAHNLKDQGLRNALLRLARHTNKG